MNIKPKTLTEQILINITPEMLEQLDNERRAALMNRSELIRRLIAEALTVRKGTNDR